MQDDWTVVFEHRAKRPCADRALVLTSLDIPHELMQTAELCLLVVPGAFAEKARFEIWQYEEENRRDVRTAPVVQPVYQDPIPGVVAYITIICLVAWMAGAGAFGFNWLYAGRIDGVLIRDGEWWRAFTALTLHSGLKHLISNVGFGALFGFLAGRVAGSGVAWLGIVLASGAANIANTILLEAIDRHLKTFLPEEAIDDTEILQENRRRVHGI